LPVRWAQLSRADASLAHITWSGQRNRILPNARFIAEAEMDDTIAAYDHARDVYCRILAESE